ncbi:MAG: radical SAM superfamily enzyme YgiQ (UPF0313 family) [Kiritimatiellia bacterium]|jgi:radical SAM superfamily enzyme YgiQ (UPF0313 family)
MKVCITQYAGIDAMSGLPLAAGLLIATARLDPQIDAAVQFSICVDRVAIDRAVQDLDNPDLLGVSMYPWNTAYSLAVAKAAKQADPGVIIVAGGPAVPRRPATARAYFQAHPFLDVLVFGEGELAFRELLRAHLDGSSLDEVPCIAFRAPNHDEDPCQFTTAPARVLDFTKTGSPYLDGTFDALVAEHPERFAMALIETNRGCPFSCTFCDWSMTKRVVELPYDRVVAELDWTAAHAMSTVCFTDANFGMRKRDKRIALHLAANKHRTGWPRTCYFYLTKNNHGRNLQTIDILHEASIGYCVGLAVQDFDDDVLLAVKRDNIQTDHSDKLGKICAERGIRTHNELILGLPHQTYDSFVRTILRAMPAHSLHEFRIFICRLIDNTELADPESRERHQIESRRCLWRPADRSFNPVINEYQEVVVATSSMSIEDWRRTCHFAYFAAAAYNQRLLRTTLRYFHEHDVDRRAYLEHLCAAMAPDSGYSVYSEMGRVVDRLLDSMLSDGPLSLPIEAFGEDLYEMAESVTAIALGAPPEFFAQTLELTRQFIDSGVDETIIDEMMRFQELGTPVWGRHRSSSDSFDHDWLTYAKDSLGEPLLQRKITVRYDPPAYARMPTIGSFVSIHLACTLAGVDTGALHEERDTVSTNQPAGMR